jgi:hypothetical protein
VDWYPTPLHSAGLLVGAMREQAMAAANVVGGFTQEVPNRYLSWASTAVRMLRPYLGSGDLDRLVTTRDYWSLRTSDPTSLGAPLFDIVGQELQRAERDLNAAVGALDGAMRDWADVTALVVPDTCVYLQADRPVDQLPWQEMVGLPDHVPVLLVVLLPVVDEIDKGKQGKTSAQARHSLKRLRPLFDHPRSALPLTEPGSARQVSARLFPDHPGHHRLELADDEIVDRAAAVGVLAERPGQLRPVHLVSFDGGMVSRASLAGLHGHWLVQPDDPWDTQAFPWPAA